MPALLTAALNFIWHSAVLSGLPATTLAALFFRQSFSLAAAFSFCSSHFCAAVVAPACPASAVATTSVATMIIPCLMTVPLQGQMIDHKPPRTARTA